MKSKWRCGLFLSGIGSLIGSGIASRSISCKRFPCATGILVAISHG